MNLASVVSTPTVTPARPNTPAYTAEWTSGCRSGQDSQSSEDDKVAESTGESAISLFNAALEKLKHVATNACRVSPLMLQLKTTWDEARQEETEVCIDKAAETCSLVCDVIAPNAGQELFQSCFTSDKEKNIRRPCAADGGQKQRHEKKREDPDSELVCISISSEDALEDP